ncbi:exodeoxyribonuclease V subunit gamma [Marinobacterium rhizophilum]|uniref:RecBCD enzyme subunit RecC n=1 Tax=Marinobacterium rhizophilum TaxID=420402 RepID=A0ABY5HNX8_9GAMM|nr:exodeoxyribonuclease V subunit gamma [Marinobacterium rhizophilum]UTW13824.1 exodeoxyribonuclease V subunit gamma [Marinobacterium rhizophilum]
MLQIYHSHSLTNLKDLLVLLIERDPLPDPFQDETILVQSPGMAQWLRLEMAASLGIAAGVQFPLPATFLWQSFAKLLPEVPERSAYRKEAMTWKLMELLPPLLPQDEFLPLRHYLEADETGFKRYQLCGKIADIFDQYLVYRPDWIEAWDRGEPEPAPLNDQAWQPLLWRALVERTRALGQPHWHRANMQQTFVKALAAMTPGGLSSRLFVFGISALPQTFLQALQALGQRIDVHLFILNPCRHYWGDIVDPAYLAKLSRRLFRAGDAEPAQGSLFDAGPAGYLESGNPLLASMGKLGRDYLHQLQDMELTGFDFFELPGEALQASQTLLGHVQRDILELEDRSIEPPGAEDSSYKTLLEPGDRSVQLHSCHSPVRELEVLQDQILALLESDPTLAPRDIIVMMPDVAAYAPHIEAVFGSARFERRIPFSISDRSLQQESPLLQSFLMLLQLPQSRLRVSEVLDLLEVPATLRRFGLDIEGFDRLRAWIEQSGVRWGLDASQRESLALPPFEQNSWRFGLRRMLAGYALMTDTELWQEQAPYGEVEGLDAVLLGPLADFIDLLEATCRLFRGARPVADWVSEINRLLLACYSPDEEDELALSQVRHVLESLQQELTDAASEAPLSAEILVDYLAQSLGEQRSSQRFMVGPVNFCTLMPMRSIPFRVLCLLGMNDGVYPRTLAPMGFDLIAKHPRRGDRSRRDDDRYLFLEALLSAQDLLYISYIGRSIADNRERVPSVLVTELLEYCTQGFVLESQRALSPEESARQLRQALVTEHPLTAYSERYFNGDSDQLFSYADQWLPAAGSRSGAASPFCGIPLAAEPVTELELDELLAFYRNPCRYFFQRRLRVSFYEQGVETLDEEPFALDGLEGYGLKQQILQAQLRAEPLDVLARRLVAQGGLPVGMAGTRLLKRHRGDVDPLAQALQPLLASPESRHEVSLALEGCQLNGWLDGVHDGSLIRYRPAGLKGHDHLRGWILHLVASAGAGLHGCQYLGVDRKAGVMRLRFKPIARDAAIAVLNRLLAGYRQGLCEPLPLAANTAWAWVSHEDKDEALKKARDAFNPGFTMPGEGDDPYIARAWPDFDSISTPLQALSEQLFADLPGFIEQED